MSPTVRTQFAKLISKLPDGPKGAFLPALNDDQLLAVSNALAKRIAGARLPDEIIELYRACGGQPWETKYGEELFPMFSLSPIERAISDYEEISDLYEFDSLPYESEKIANSQILGGTIAYFRLDGPLELERFTQY
ncbi:MAG: SMI1/KNR4 family protein [Planctomycetota bacterium]